MFVSHSLQGFTGLPLTMLTGGGDYKVSQSGAYKIFFQFSAYFFFKIKNSSSSQESLLEIILTGFIRWSVCSQNIPKYVA